MFKKAPKNGRSGLRWLGGVKWGSAFERVVFCWLGFKKQRETDTREIMAANSVASNKPPAYDYLIKLLLIGDSGMCGDWVERERGKEQKKYVGSS